MKCVLKSNKHMEHNLKLFVVHFICNRRRYCELSVQFKLSKEVFNKCIDFFSSNIMKSFQNGFKEGLCKPTKGTLIKILESDQLLSNERKIFDAVFAWGSFSLENQDANIPSDDVVAEIADCIRYIRFPLMKSMDLVACVEKLPKCLKNEEFCDILFYIDHKRALTTAQQFSTNTRKRHYVLLTPDVSNYISDETAYYNIDNIILMYSAAKFFK